MAKKNTNCMELISMIPYPDFHCLNGLKELLGDPVGRKATPLQFVELQL